MKCNSLPQLRAWADAGAYWPIWECELFSPYYEVFSNDGDEMEVYTVPPWKPYEFKQWELEEPHVVGLMGAKINKALRPEVFEVP